MTVESPLHAIHEQLGASFTDFAGWNMPVRYSSELAEHKAVREAAGIFDLSHMAEIEIVGPEVGEMLDHAFVGNFSNLRVGRARYSMLCDSDGGILDDLVTYRLDDERYLVVANAANADVALAALRERSASFDADVQDQNNDYVLIAVQGPNASSIVGPLADADITELKYYGIVPAVVAEQEVLLARTGYTGEDGFELYCTPAQAEPLWRALTEAGEPYGLQPAGLACRDTLRLEAGMPLYGNELSTATTPFEANLGKLVKFEKRAEFVGKAALAKRQENPTGQVLVGLQGTGKRAPRTGYRILDGETDIGVVTSGTLSPTLGYPIAIGSIDSSRSEPGTKLNVDVRGRSHEVEVVSLPFYKR